MKYFVEEISYPLLNQKEFNVIITMTELDWKKFKETKDWKKIEKLIDEN